MVSTADHCAQDLVLARRGRCSKIEFLYAGLKFKVPAGHFGVVFGVEQSKSVHGAVTVPTFSFVGVDAQQKRFACFHGDLRLRSEEHTSELQSLTNLVCRLLLE